MTCRGSGILWLGWRKMGCVHNKQLSTICNAYYASLIPSSVHFHHFLGLIEGWATWKGLFIFTLVCRKKEKVLRLLQYLVTLVWDGIYGLCILYCCVCSLFPFHSSPWTELPLTKSGSFGQLRISRFPAELEKSDRSTAAKTDGQPTQIQGSETWSGVLHNSINSLEAQVSCCGSVHRNMQRMFRGVWKYIFTRSALCFLSKKEEKLNRFVAKVLNAAVSGEKIDAQSFQLGFC